MEEYIIAIPNRKPGEPDPAVVRSEIVGKLVRCEDCKYRCGNTICALHDLYSENDWFCADGVKRDG